MLPLSQGTLSPEISLHHSEKTQNQKVFTPAYDDQSPGPDLKSRSSLTRSCRSLFPWLTEILSWTISLAGIAAVVVVLRIYDNQPLSKWPQEVALNAVTSTLA